MVGLGWLFVVVSRLFYVWCTYRGACVSISVQYLCSFVGAFTSVPLVSFVCFVSTNGGLFFTVVRIQSKIVFEFKNLTAICLNAAHWI